MTLFSLAEAAALVPDAVVLGDAETRFERVVTDSRQVAPGDLFVALKGEQFDGHAYLSEVAARGAAAVLVARSPADWRVPALRVANTRRTLGLLARGWRRRFTLPLVAVAGSNGKTTVKGMIAAIFASQVGERRRLATRGNLNNDIGLPLTLFELNDAHRLGVVELGMNHPGETEFLARLAEPTIALINNAQREHQEFMASVEAVALEHASVIHALPRSGIAVFPADDAYTGIWRVAASGNPIVDFALQKGDDVPARSAVSGAWSPHGVLRVHTPTGAFEVRLKALGAHNAHNALAAAAAACAAGVANEAIARGLADFEPVDGRLRVKAASVAPFAGASVIDDTYNANPDSMRAAIDVLADRAGPRLLVMGDMGEVGDHGPAFHREAGAYARACGIDALYALGAATLDACRAFGDRARHYRTFDELLADLAATWRDADARGATILVKGSRFMRMERVVDALTGARFDKQTTGQAPVGY